MQPPDFCGPLRRLPGTNRSPILFRDDTVAAWAALLRERGLPAVVWSCIANTCHQPNERSSITATLKDAQVFAHILMNAAHV